METLPVTIQIICLVGAGLFMVYVFQLIVRGRLREEYSIIWILCSILLIVFSIWRSGLQIISKLLGVYYPPSLLFLVAVGAIMVFLLHLSRVNSRLQGQIKSLTQEVALLKFQLNSTLNQIKSENATVTAETNAQTELNELVS